MKKIFLKFFDKALVAVLGLVGIVSCDGINNGTNNLVCEYGVPHADYEIIGTILIKDTKEPIKNIRVIHQYNPAWGDTIYSDEAGKYEFNYQEFPLDVHKLKFEDADGLENGGEFETKEIEITFTEADKVKKGDGWYEGKYSTTRDIELEHKTAEAEE